MMEPLVLLALLFAGSGFVLSLLFGLTVSPLGGLAALRRVCRLGEGSCASLARRPEGRLAGLPNWVIGLAYYLAVTAALVMPAPGAIGEVVVLASWVSVAAGLYLVHALVVRIRVSCPVCFLAHAVNAALALTLTIWQTTRF
jgi:uncharacterized membrane protein